MTRPCVAGPRLAAVGGCQRGARRLRKVAEGIPPMGGIGGVPRVHVTDATRLLHRLQRCSLAPLVKQSVAGRGPAASAAAPETVVDPAGPLGRGCLAREPGSDRLHAARRGGRRRSCGACRPGGVRRGAPESARWLESRGRSEEAEALIARYGVGVDVGAEPAERTEARQDGFDAVLFNHRGPAQALLPGCGRRDRGLPRRGPERAPQAAHPAVLDHGGSPGLGGRLARPPRRSSSAVSCSSSSSTPPPAP